MAMMMATMVVMSRRMVMMVVMAVIMVILPSNELLHHCTDQLNYGNADGCGGLEISTIPRLGSYTTWSSLHNCTDQLMVMLAMIATYPQLSSYTNLKL